MRQLARPFTNGSLVQAAPFIGHQAGANLDHHAVRIAQDGVASKIYDIIRL
jgi:hypothetical protein